MKYPNLPRIDSVISWSDDEHHEGIIYKSSNFKTTGKSGGALHGNGIRSPLLETQFTKTLVRKTAKSVGISIYDKPSNSCLASRIPWGQRVTAEKLARIEIGEKIIKQKTGIQQVRVRDIDGTARIEVEANKIHLLNKEITCEIFSKLKMIGFSDVKIDPDGYFSGKLNMIYEN